jgi:hypothetical protein
VKQPYTLAKVSKQQTMGTSQRLELFKTATKTKKWQGSKSELPLKLPLNSGNSKAYSL